MTLSVLQRSCLLLVLAILLSTPSAVATTQLRGVQLQTSPEEMGGAVKSANKLSTLNDGHSHEPLSSRSNTRHLYGMEYDRAGGIDVGEYLSNFKDEVESSSSSTTSGNTAVDGASSLVGRPVYFEKQSEDPNGGYTNPFARVVGGSDSPEQRNFCLHLKWDSRQEQYVFAGCGGALISNCHVLTAAHCSSHGRLGLPDGLYCNAYNPFEGNYGRDFHFSVMSQAIIHPDFNNFSNQNDVAILELETCVEDLSQYPVMKVADQAFMRRMGNDATVTVSGFGRTSESSSTQVEHLQQVDLPFIPRGSCQAFYPGLIYDDMLCAGNGAAGGLDSCQGDSGGSLFHEGPPGGDGNQTAIGVVSWGSGCAAPNKPGVYASTAYHHDWIKEQVCSHSRTDKSIALCSTPPPTSAPDTGRSTCSSIHQTCDVKPCCNSLECKTRTVGAAPICSISSSNNRSHLSSGRGGVGGASGNEVP